MRLLWVYKHALRKSLGLPMPPRPNWYFLAFWSGLLLLGLVTVGLLLSQIPPPERPSLQQHLNILEQWVRALERR